MMAPAAPLLAELLDLLVNCTVAAVVAELDACGNPHRDSTDRAIETRADEDFDGEGLGRPA